MENNINKFDINMYAVLLIGALAFMIFVMGCESPKQNNEQAADTVSIDNSAVEPNNVAVHEEDSTIHALVEKYPELEYSYIQTEDGNIVTVKGNYQVKVDGIDNDQDLNKFVKYVEGHFADQELMRKEYNKNVQTAAEPKDGYDAYYQAIKTNVEYPEEALDNNVGGTVIVEFVVDENGKVSEVKPVESIYYTKNKEYIEALDEAAVEAIKTTDWTWTPAKQGNSPVRMKLEIPITFEAES
ncbi:energy transducer TonB [Fulvivirga sediminis]|uniref:Energy transducer TonB n=1 Tax=Fulvivirga sediminis TaxID=2803949 RepID=A0A937F675_9BACT|nr:energy transducer TonB [Fulvivirga sediminis]MBL3654753.1 energy transducer TonB [Fulvivirga sediminis]